MGYSREKEIIDIATIMRHGLTLNKNNLIMNDDSVDNVNALGLLEYFTTHTKSEENLKSIKTSEISDIFRSFENSEGFFVDPRYILIEGAPGMGKTTLCKEIAYQWAKGYLLKDTKLLFLIYLRDPAISNIKDLEDLVHYFYSFDKGATKLSKQCAEDLTNTESNNVTIIFDGFDEFNGFKDSLITNIIFNRKILPQCKIIVTSRLTASNRLHRIADVRVEIMGFTDESKIQYIKQELKDSPDQIEKLQSYLNKHPSIKSACYMPMMMTILVYVFKEKGCLPSNYTELYDKFVALTISYHLQKQKMSKDVFVSLQKLPEEYKCFVTNMSQFAFFTLKDKQKVFSTEDIKNVCPKLTANLDTLGLINSVHYFCTDKGNTNVFNFLHLSIHEYLAAYYISSIDQHSQFNELENTFLNEMYQETWNMFIAMNKNNCLIFQNHFIYCKDEYHELLSKWIVKVKSSSFLDSIIQLHDNIRTNAIYNKNVQILLFVSDQSCHNAAYSYQEMYLSLCSRKQVDQTKIELFVIEKVVKDFKYWFKPLQLIYSANKLSTILYRKYFLIFCNVNQQQVVDCFKLKNLVARYIALARCHISKTMINVIKSFNMQSLLGFVLFNCTYECSALNELGNYLSMISTLLSIVVKSNNFSAQEFSTISSLILNNHNIKILDLSNNNLCNDVIKVAKALEHTRTLEVLILTNNNIPQSAATAISNIISSNTSLRVFCIGNNKLKMSIVVILEVLCRISSLQALELHDNQITEEAGEAIASVILTNTKLQHLILNNNNIGKGILHIAKALKQLNSLKTLGLHSTNMPKEISDEIASAIEYNQCLSNLQLGGNNLQYSAIIILQAISKISSLQTLDLQGNQLNEDAVEHITSITFNNPQLENLHLNNNNMGKGILQLEKVLQACTSLKSIYLGYNNLSAEESLDLGLVIQSNEHIQSVWLPCVSVKLQSIMNISTLTILNLNNSHLLQEEGEVLSFIILNNTRLVNLDLGNNKLGNGGSPVIKAIQHLIQLRTLHLGNINITKEISEECGEALSHAISNNSYLENVHLNDNDINAMAIQVAKGLQQITSLKLLNLGNCNLPNEMCNELAHVISCNKCLEQLLLPNNNLCSSARFFLHALSSISTLIVLNLQGCQLTEEVGKHLSSVILSNSRLNQLLLDNNDIGKGIVHTVQALQQINSLQVLSLNNTNMPMEICDEIAKAINCNPQLIDVRLDGNSIQHSAVVILQALSKVSSLKILSLQSNDLTEDAGEQISSIIFNNTGLEQLYLNNNNINKGIACIVNALHKHTSLTQLGLGHNNFPTDQYLDLTLAVQSNQYLQTLWLPCINIKSSTLQSMMNISTLTELNLSNSQLLQETGEVLSSILLNNTRLAYLYLGNNNLNNGALPVIKAMQHLTQIRTLHLGNIKITKEVCEECGEAFSHAISNNTHLENVYLNDNDINTIAIQVSKGLQQITSLKLLDLGNCNLPREICGELAHVISCNKYLEKLLLPNNNLCSSAELILQALSSISTIKVLNLKHCHLTEEAGKHLSSVILNNSRINQLLLDNNDIGKGILHIAQALQQINSLQVLGLKNTNMPMEICGKMALAIKSNPQLINLQLDGNSLHYSAVVILQALSKISSLKILNLNSNQLTKDVGEQISSIIMNNPRLEQLDLNHNNISKGVVSIVRALHKHKSLTHLGLGYNQFPTDQLLDLTLAIQSNQLLQSLCLPCININSSTLQSMMSISRLTFLNLNNSQLLPEMGEVLSSIILNNTRLENLDLGNNNLSNGALPVIKAIQHLTQLRTLYLNNINITKEVCEECGEALSHAISKNIHLENVHLSSNDINTMAIQVAKGLQQITSLKLLNLGNCNLPKEMCNELAHVISCNKYLEKLLLPNNNLCSSAELILQALSSISTIKVLHFQGCQLTEEAGKHLSSVILNNSRLNQLLLDNNDIGKGILHIAQALQQINSLQVLGLKNTNMPMEICGEMALVIKCNPQLINLQLDGNSLHHSAVVILQALSKVSSLKILNLNSNQLTKDVGEQISSIIMNNPRLEQLGLNHNNISKGVVSIVRALHKHKSLTHLGLGYNQFPTDQLLDLTLAIQSNQLLQSLCLPCININSSTLQSMMSISRLTFLNLNNSQLLPEMGEVLSSIILNNTRLENLDLGNNNLSNGALPVIKAIQHLTQLRTLYLNNINITKEVCEECGEALSHAISNNTHLENIHLNNNDINTMAIQVAKGLQQITSLKLLNLGNCNLPKEMCNELAHVISCNKYLEKLLLPNNNLCSSAELILQALSSISTIKVLHLQGCQLTEEAGKHLSSVILNNSRLNQLLLDNNDIGKGILHIAQALQWIKSLQVLSLNNTNIPMEICGEMALVIKSNPQLINLQLDGNSLHHSAVVILQALSKVSSLKILNLNSNQLTKDVGEQISSIIMNNPRLEQLGLNHNNISKGVVSIVRALHKHQSLTHLGLGYNQFPTDQLLDLTLAIQSNQLLQSVCLPCININSSTLQSMMSISRLTFLNLNNSQLLPEMGEVLSSIILNNTRLENLNLGNNNLNNGALPVIKAIQHLTQLRTLYLNNINITKEESEECGEALSHAISNNTHLENVHLNNNDINTMAIQVAKGLQQISSLKLLNLGNCNLPKEMCNELAHVISCNKCLEQLLLPNNNLCCSSVVYILQALNSISTLTVLRLQGCQLTEEAGKHLSSVILNNSRLNQLLLDNNDIGKGILHIAQALQQINSLQVLGLKNTNMPMEICGEIAKAINCNPHISILQLDGNSLHHSAVVMLQALSKVSSLKLLSLQSNDLIEDAGEHISSIIFNNPGLEQLIINHNNIGKGIVCIIKALHKHTSLIRLGMGYNNFPIDHHLDLTLAIQSNQLLQLLWLPCINVHSSTLQSMMSISTLTALNLNNSQLLQETGELLSSIILNNTMLVNLNLGNNNLGNGALHVIKAIQHLTQLRTLHLGNINITKEVCEGCGEALSHALSNNTHLENIQLNDNDINVVAIHVAKGLQQITSLKLLNLGDCNLPSEICGELAHVISCNKYLETLWLPNNNLFSSAELILPTFCSISTIKVLNLKHCHLTEKAGKHLSSVILNNSRINQLLLDNNDIGKGILHIAQALQQINSLQVLGLKNTNMPMEICGEMALAIKSNPQLINLQLDGNSLHHSAVVILQALSKVSSLKILNLNSNQLTKDVGEQISSIIMNNPRLEQLGLNHNNISEGVVSIVRALHKHKSLTHLGLGYNQFPTDQLLDLTLAIQSNQLLQSLCLPCININSSTLQSMMSISRLTFLNLNNSQLLPEMGEVLSSIILNNTRLENLDLGNNNLSNGALPVIKAIQHLTQLRTLYLNNINITKEVCEECGEALSHAISNNTHLENVHLNNNDINTMAIQVAKGLQQITSIKLLNLGNCNLPKEMCNELAHVISCNKYLEKLLLPNNNLCSSAELILQALSSISTIKVLHLQGCQLTEEAGKHLSSVILNNSRLNQLLLDNNDIGKGILHIAQALQWINSLQVLGLKNTNMPMEICGKMALAIKSNPQLINLQLDGNSLHHSAVVILQALSKVSSLKILNLNSNQLTKDVGEQISSIIMNNPRLEQLGLNHNNISKGVVSIVRALHKHQSLTHLGLGYNQFPTDQYLDLTLAIQSNQLLQSLCLPCININSSTLQSMMSISRLTFLNLNNSQLLPEMGEVLSSIILNNTRLENLDLGNNNLSNGALPVIKSLQHLTQLRTLYLNNINITKELCEECGEALSYALSNNTHLENVYLNDNDINAMAKHVAKGLQQITSLKLLNLGNCNLPDEMCSELAHVISCNKCLETLLLSNNDLCFSTELILRALSSISTIKVLNLKCCQLIEEAGKHLSSVILNNKRINQLLLDNNDIGKGILHIAQALQQINSLQVLGLKNTNMPMEICGEMALAIKCNPQLIDLQLDGNSLHHSAVVILQALSKVSSLKIISLQSNDLTEDAGEQISSIIFNNPGLEQLHLNDNNICKGIVCIVNALHKHTSLTDLDLGNNHFPTNQCLDLTLAIQSNQHLQTLWLPCINIKSSTLQSMMSISTFTDLNLNNSQLLQEMGEVLSSIILNNTKLENLDLGNNNLGNGALPVFKSLQHLAQLRTLYLGNINITKELCEECGEALSYALSNNTHLENVYLNDNDINAMAKHVAKGLQQITSLKSLNLGNCNLPSVMCGELAHVISCNKYLETLLLPNNNLCSSTELILPALSSISTLKVLNLKCCQLTEEAGKHLSSVIVNNKRINQLQLDNNNIGKGILHIVQALQQINSLQVLGLDNTNMPMEICGEMALAIKCNPQLIDLQLDGNSLHHSAVVILQALSKVSSLKIISLQSNDLTEDAGEQISSIIFNNPGLEQLHLNDNNICKGIVCIVNALHKHTSLTDLDLGNNHFPTNQCLDLTLAIKSNQHLQTLWLPCINIKSSTLQSMMSISTFTDLNLNNSQLLQEMGEVLSSIILNNTKLENLDLGNNNLGNGTLPVFKSLQHLAQLRTLYLGNINITKELCEECGEALSYALSNNTHLENVYLNDNDINAMAKHVAKGLQQITSLKLLNLGNCNLPDEICGELAHVISCNKYLETLFLPNNNLCSSTVLILQALSRNSTLRVIGLQGNQLTAEAGEHLASVVLHNMRLEQLYFSEGNFKVLYFESRKMLEFGCSNNIPEENYYKIEFAFTSHTSKYIEKLWLHKMNLHSSIFILNSLKTITTLKVLHLNNIQINQEASKALASIILHNTGLEELKLSNNNLDEGMLEVVESLRHITALRSSDLCNNNISESFSGELALAIKVNERLEQLQLYNNNLKSSAVVILKSLNTISTLKVLDISDNQITKEAREALTTAILHNKGLEELYLSNSNLGEGALQVVNALQQITSLKVLDLGNCNLPKEICGELAHVIDCNKYLEQLLLPDNNLCSSTVLILQALSRNSTLRVINLQGNQLTAEAGEYLASVVLHNIRLEQLYFSEGNFIVLYFESRRMLEFGCSNNIPEESYYKIEFAFTSHTSKYIEKLWLHKMNLHSSIFILNLFKTITTLKVLHLNNIQINQEASKALASIILHNRGLKELHFSNSNLDEGMLEVAKSLQQITGLRSLNLCNNNISESFSGELALAIKVNEHLEQLRLNNINLKSSAVVILKSLSTIKVLNISDNQITKEAREALTTAILHNKGLEELYLSNSNLGEGALQVVNALQQITSLKVLDLGNCNLPKEICGELAHVIDCNKYLEQLLLPNNNLCSSTVLILQALSRNSTLRVIDLQGNQLTAEADKYLASVVLHNIRLEELHFN